MIRLFYVYLLMPLMIPPPSILFPIPLKNEKIRKIVEPEPVYVSREELEDGSALLRSRQKRDEPEEWTEGDQQEALSADAMETMRKINPLTIANQVSELFHKNDPKNNPVEKSSLPVDLNTLGNEEEVSNPIRDEDPQEVVNFAVQPETEELNRNPSPMYFQQEPPKIVNKPRPNEFGYSVIVLAGDPVNLPIKVLSKGMQEDEKTLGKEELEGKTDEKANCYRNPEEESIPNEKMSKEEIRVPKQYNVKTDFPVYDEDFSFIPDPFQGILDENYLKEHGAQSDHSAVQKEESQRFQPHAVYIRSNDAQGPKEAEGSDFQCGSWKNNMTAALTS
uniref:Uncharacterized protein n=1 Tax=Cuerna arida TaxID=1464854 RepID=A0A1B6GG45_9HEMI